MAGMGPPPKDPARRARRNTGPSIIRLPAAGRQGKPPRWPLPANIRLTSALASAKANLTTIEERVLTEPDGGVLRELARVEERVALLQAQLTQTKRMESALWRELWKLPQAVMWERLVYTREVAQYVRWACLGQVGEMDAAREARQLADRLGLTPMSMLRLRWEVQDDQDEAAHPAAATPGAAARSRYGHLRVAMPDETASGA